jgi:hypothetical protein
MGEKLRTRIELLALLIAVVSGGSGLVGAFIVLPQRMDAMEIRVEKISNQRENDRELLLRIEERLIAVQAELRRGK